jgi:hypothetical protein
MSSRFEHIKKRVLTARRRGASLRDIEKYYGVPKSTLSYWFRDLTLSRRYQIRLEERNRAGLVAARKEAVKWHNAQKEKRLAHARKDAESSLLNIKHTQAEIMELALAFLYLGEGTKKSGNTSMGNSDEMILRFFVTCLHSVYEIPYEKLKCDVHLRADQNENRIKRYWSRTLNIPLRNFGKSSIDTRTHGRPTYGHYKGVCVVRCGRVDIQRKLMYIASSFCGKVANDMRG